MVVSELIKVLEKSMAQHGDIEVSKGYSEYPAGNIGIDQIELVEWPAPRGKPKKRFLVLTDGGLITED